MGSWSPVSPELRTALAPIWIPLKTARLTSLRTTFSLHVLCLVGVWLHIYTHAQMHIWDGRTDRIGRRTLRNDTPGSILFMDRRVSLEKASGPGRRICVFFLHCFSFFISASEKTRDALAGNSAGCLRLWHFWIVPYTFKWVYVSRYHLFLSLLKSLCLGWSI